MSAPSKPALIDAWGLRVRLGSRLVLDDVGLALHSGSLCALVGPNGAGKSTLLRALAGLAPVDSGTIRRADGRSTAGRSHVTCRDIAYLPQDRTVHWDLSVARVVGLGRLAHAQRHNDERAVDAAMTRMDIGHLAERSIREVSGGERARVLIARALAQETPVLLADEPVAGLDPAHQLSLFEHLRTMAHEGKAVLVALHDLSLALRFADRVVLMHEGRVVADGPPGGTLTRDRIAEVFGIDSRIEMVGGIPIFVPQPLAPGEAPGR